MAGEASSTALEIHVLLPAPRTSDTFETPPLKDGVRFRSPKRASDGPSHLEAGNQHQFSSSGDSDGSGIIHTLQDVLSFAKLLFLLFLSEIFKNLLLFRQPVACASELRPLLEQAQICGDEARSLFCTLNDASNLSTPSSVRSFQKSWERYLEGKTEEWKAAAGEVVFLAAFIFAAVQFAEKNDPATRVFAFVAVEALAFSFMVSRLLSRHLHKRRVEDLHYGFHLLEVNFVSFASPRVNHSAASGGRIVLHVEYANTTIDIWRFDLVGEGFKPAHFCICGLPLYRNQRLQCRFHCVSEVVADDYCTRSNGGHLPHLGVVFDLYAYNFEALRDGG
ncbi:hypothetical protein C8F04DRAFT_1182261 [Mycena alexandri]|uniref:Uncharacterized protein n=1 Tax=Mycena alexandri TaxID=1745969 RepID=A0AAD6SXZ5_9AGAR|nr:hypothetical protein C8F04DRAFT_1182261 [Mycena alexandri]